MKPRAPAIMRRTLSASLLLLMTSVPADAQEPFTVEQVLSSPFPADLVAAASGGRVAWVFNAEGVRNIWVAEAPEFRARPVTDYTADDGQALGGLTWTPDGSALAYVRGGDRNREGVYPNPRSRPGGIEQQVWLVGLADGEPRLIGEGDSPAIAPDGELIAFLKGGDIWWAPVDTSGEARPLVELRGSATDLRWSPDGSKLAFSSRRGDHSFVGVYERGTDAVTWIDPGVDHDRDPVWSPDGARIAFVRTPDAEREVIFTARRTGQPWSIRVADVATGEGREVFRAEPGYGSVFRGVAAEGSLFWAAGDRLVFPWETDGWLHLYSVPADGGQPVSLTPGDFEVEYVTLSPDRRRVIYNSNQGDIDRRHLWRVSAEGSRAPTPLTGGDGIEWAPAPIPGSDGVVALLRSDARGPARPAILRPDGVPTDLAPGTIPADFPAQQLVEPQPVVFTAADGMKIHGQLFLPEGAAPADGRPGVLFFHGGSRRQMLLGWHYMGYYHRAYALNQYLASRGYVVLSVNYRSGIGYGLEFREALNYGAGGASEFNDVLGAGLYLASRPAVDSARIGLWGGSYGGYLTALGLARASDLFAAGVDIHGVHDWNVVIQNFVPSYDPLEHPEAARTARQASPMADIATWRSPVLLIHGDDDRNVPFSETVDLVRALRDQGVEFEELVFPDEVHGFLLHSNWLQAYGAAADFFDRHLGARTRRARR